MSIVNKDLWEKDKLSQLKKEQKEFNKSESSWIWVGLVLLLGFSGLVVFAIMVTK